MSIDHTVPPLRDFPAGRLDARKAHLLAEIVRGHQRSHLFSLPWLASPRRRVTVLAIVVGLLVIGTAVAATTGILLGRSDVPFSEAPPATSIIKRDFADMSSGAPKGMDPRVASGQARLAGTFAFGGVKRHVWVAPTESGGFCYLFQGISGGCTEVEADPIVLDGGFFARAGATTPAMESLAGRIYAPRATQLRVTFEDGRTLVLPFVYVSEPIGAGFFAYKPTRAEEQRGHRPADVVLLDADGTEVGRETINWANEDRKLESIRAMFAEQVEKLKRAKQSTTTTDPG